MGCEFLEPLENYADKRKQRGCIHCGAEPKTKDHVPSKVFLDKPHPDFPPFLPSCLKCNNDLSLDEEYFSCFLECVIMGSTDPASIKREKVKKALLHKPQLGSRIHASRQESPEGLKWMPESQRIINVILKCARGHAAYEQNEWRHEEPDHVNFFPMHTLTDLQRATFENPISEEITLLPEVGTRAIQRLRITNVGAFMEVWIEVQPERYRYYVHYEGEILLVRMVFSEYLGAEVIWSH